MKIDTRIEILPVPSRAGSPERRSVPLVDAPDRDGRGQQHHAYQRYNARKRLEDGEDSTVPIADDEAVVEVDKPNAAKIDLRA